MPLATSSDIPIIPIVGRRLQAHWMVTTVKIELLATVLSKTVLVRHENKIATAQGSQTGVVEEDGEEAPECAETAKSTRGMCGPP